MNRKGYVASRSRYRKFNRRRNRITRNTVRFVDHQCRRRNRSIRIRKKYRCTIGTRGHDTEISTPSFIYATVVSTSYRYDGSRIGITCISWRPGFSNTSETSRIIIRKWWKRGIMPGIISQFHGWVRDYRIHGTRSSRNGVAISSFLGRIPNPQILNRGLNDKPQLR